MKVITTVLGIGAAGFGLKMAMDVVELQAAGQTVQGTITGTKTFRCGDEEDGYYDCYSRIVSFDDGQGRAIVFTQHLRSADKSWRRGDLVTVLFDPLKPQDAVLDTWFDLWILPTMAAGCGLVFFLVGVFFKFDFMNTSARAGESGTGAT